MAMMIIKVQKGLHMSKFFFELEDLKTPNTVPLKCWKKFKRNGTFRGESVEHLLGIKSG